VLVQMIAAPSGLCQKAVVTVDPKSGNIQLKAMTSQDLKDAIGDAVKHGDITASDGKELMDKITDMETLMDQFDFIREQERNMISSMGSLYR
jgi:hypothetical protein